MEKGKKQTNVTNTNWGRIEVLRKNEAFPEGVKDLEGEVNHVVQKGCETLAKEKNVLLTNLPKEGE